MGGRRQVLRQFLCPGDTPSAVEGVTIRTRREASLKGHEPRANPASGDDPQFLRAVARSTQVLRARPGGLITDIDGTISPIAPSPEEALVLPGCREALRRLARKLELVAAVSGRPLESVRPMVGLDELVYVGNHGLERWDAAGGLRDIGNEPHRSALLATLQFLKTELRDVPGVRFEDKGLGFSVHYRGSPEPGQAREAVLAALGRAPMEALAVLEGKSVVEVRPPLATGKGTAVRELANEFGLRAVVYLGDDVTDLEAFAAVRELREAGEVQGLAVAVVGPEAPKALEGEADVTLQGPEEVESFLARLADELPEKEAS